MLRPKVSRTEIEKRLQGHDDPVRRLPAGFATMHSRIRPTPSEFVVAAIERVKAAGGDDFTPDAESIARREELRTRRAAAVAARRR